MNSIIAYTIKVFGVPGSIALGAAVALAISSAALGLQLYAAKADVRTAEAAQTVAEAQRDAEKAAALAAGESATGWQTVAKERLDLLTSCNAENQRLVDANADAIANAQAKARDAEVALRSFIDRYAQDIRNPDCAAARQRLESSCPNISY